MWVVVLASGCASPSDEACRPGFTRAQDGHCYPPPPDPEPPTANEVLEGIGPCVPLKDGDEIDVAGGCLEGACAGRQFSAIDRALGGGADCDTNSSGSTWICVWPQQVESQFPVAQGDGGGPDVNAYSTLVRARSAYEGASPEGLGLAVSVRCWVDVLGAPSRALFVDVAGSLAPTELVWDRYGVEIEDERRLEDGAAVPDGLVDELTLTGPP